MSTNDLITHYYDEGLTNKEIVTFLAKYNDVVISERTVKRILRKLGLRRRNAHEDPLHVIKAAVQDAVSPMNSSSLLGYRKVWALLKSSGINAKLHTVRLIIREIDPEGVESRRKRRLKRRRYSVPGPNFLWHIDGYDKLKPYGFSIHGCIDGFSRKLLWLVVGTTNKRPEVIAHHYLKAVKEIGGLPTRIRSDDGTEHSIIEPMQIYLRSADLDEYAGVSSYLVGTSPANQRIEAFWSQLSKDRPLWWRMVFSKLETMGYLDTGNMLNIECLRFCFMDILRQELNDIAYQWNKHPIRKDKSSVMPAGKPNSLYLIPELVGCEDCKQAIDLDEVNEFDDPLFVAHTPDNDPNFVEFAETVLDMYEMDVPSNFSEALQLYFVLLKAIDEYLLV